MIYDISPVNNHQGNDCATNFDFKFYIDNVSQIKVYHFDSNKIKRELVLDIDYSISKVQNQNGGYIIFPLEGSSYSVLKSDEQISIELDLPISQESEFNNSTDVNLDAFEYSFDYLTRLIQILKRKLSLCVKVEECSDVSPEILIENINEAHKNCVDNAQKIQKLKSNIETALTLADKYYEQVEDFTNDLLSSNAYKLKNIQTTNCLTEVPQNIKLELVDGVLTLKAGSKVTVPNGIDGYKEVVVSSDRTLTSASDDKYMIFTNSTGSTLEYARLNTQVGSGTSTPTSGYWAYYNTSDNKIYRINDGVVARELAFPLGLITVSNGVISSIDDVYNGIGCIGNTTFANKGIKGLIPNGRNEDGTLNNIEFETQSVLTQTRNIDGEGVLILASNYLSNYAVANYNDDENFVRASNGAILQRAIVGTWSADSTGKFTEISVKQPFRAVDWNEFNALNQNALLISDKAEISGWSMPSTTYIDLTLGEIGASYTAPADGWVTIRTIGEANHYVTLSNGDFTYEQICYCGIKGNAAAAIIPIKKGEKFKAFYNTYTELTWFRFLYAEGAK